ncbi:hypothetical protein ACI65C_007717 [Semiaphis heraclei]
MESIKKYFIQTVKHVEDNVEKPMDENYELNVHTIFNKTLDKKASFIINEMTIQSYSESTDTTKLQDTIKHLLHKIKCLEEKYDRVSSITEENKNIKNKQDSFKCNNCTTTMELANKNIAQLSDTVIQLRSELQLIKSSATSDDDSAKIKQLNDTRNSSDKKIRIYRDQIIQLKKELEITQNALSNEVGDPAVMQTILKGTGFSNRIGRAQLILRLQQQVNELRAKTNESTKELHNSTVNTRKIKKASTAIDDQILKDTQSKVNELTKSVDIWKGRSKALEVEITVLRVHIEKILAKSESDHQLIDKLKAEMSNRNIQRLKTKVSVPKLEESITLLRSKYEKALKTIEQQTSDLNDRNMRISQLESTIQDRNISSIDFSDPKEIFIKKFNGFENQHLVDLLSIAHNKLCQQVLDVTDLKIKYSMETKKSQKLKSKMEYFYSTLKKTSNNNSYQLKQELNLNEKLIDLENKLELVEEECAALKERSDTLVMLNKKNVNTFTRSLNSLKLQLIQEMK